MTSRSNLLIVGAGGRTGSILARYAVAQGHTVTTLARRSLPSEVDSGVDRRVTGDATDPRVMAEAVDGQDAVITAVAAADRKPATMVSEITQTAIAAMETANVARLVVTSSRNLTATKPWIAVTPTKWIFRHVYADLARAETMVRSSKLDWTIVRAVMLTDDPARDGVHVDREAKPTGGDWKLSRADYAKTLLDTVLDPAAIGESLGINGLAKSRDR